MRRRGFIPPTSHSSESFSMRSAVSGEVEVVPCTLPSTFVWANDCRLLRQRDRGSAVEAWGAGGRLRSCDGIKRAPRRAGQGRQGPVVPGVKPRPS
jgi:hypothetical protein